MHCEGRKNAIGRANLQFCPHVRQDPYIRERYQADLRTSALAHLAHELSLFAATRPRIVEKARIDAALLTNPGELTGEAIAAILDAAW